MTPNSADKAHIRKRDGVRSLFNYYDGALYWKVSKGTVKIDNREDLNPLHTWLISGDAINHLMTASISPSTIHKWDKYRLDTSKVSACCDELRYFKPE